jgi:sugar O-acyltransferase (sialic acid O-acetyltransferase NeuD family)
MSEVKSVGIFGVATVFAWEIVESVQRLNLSIECIDNLGNANAKLPNLKSSINRETPIIMGPSTPWARNKSSLLAFESGYLNLTSVFDPTSVIASTAHISHGVYVNASATIGSNTRISCNSVINRSVSIGHDCEVEQYASIGPGAILTGHVKIGLGVFIGAGAVILPRVEIGKGAIIGAGSVVVKDVPNGAIVVGNPASFLKKNEQLEELKECPWH